MLNLPFQNRLREGRMAINELLGVRDYEKKEKLLKSEKRSTRIM